MTPQLSVVVTTYNRAAILAKCLDALLHQEGDPSYEVLVVDDGSTDETPGMLDALMAEHPRLRVYRQPNGGRASARNAGIREARGLYLCYVDSDVFVAPGFVKAHLDAHAAFQQRLAAGKAGKHKDCFVQGLSVNISRLEDAYRVKVFDPSRAFFDTKNVSLKRAWLQELGGFDTGFVEYGWEDLELGVRLKERGVTIVRARDAYGFHFHPAFTVDDLPKLRRLEEERGRMAARFYRLRPTWEVRLMIQLTPLHDVLNAIATWGGLLDETKLRGVLAWLERRGKAWWAGQWAQIVLNQYNLRELHRALRDA
jgi:glycosyltransferase involved in cell wall biosynthesis